MKNFLRKKNCYCPPSKQSSTILGQKKNFFYLFDFNDVWPLLLLLLLCYWSSKYHSYIAISIVCCCCCCWLEKREREKKNLTKSESDFFYFCINIQFPTTFIMVEIWIKNWMNHHTYITRPNINTTGLKQAIERWRYSLFDPH